MAKKQIIPKTQTFVALHADSLLREHKALLKQTGIAPKAKFTLVDEKTEKPVSKKRENAFYKAVEREENKELKEAASHDAYLLVRYGEEFAYSNGVDRLSNYDAPPMLELYAKYLKEELNLFVDGLIASAAEFREQEALEFEDVEASY